MIVAGRRRRDADDRLQQRRLAGAVAPEQRDDLVLVHVERHVAQDVALAVERVDAGEAEQDVLGALPIALAGPRARVRRTPM